MQYTDTPEDLVPLVKSIPVAETAKIAIVRPTRHFQIVTDDNPDMVRTLALQENYVTTKLAQIPQLLTEQQREQKRKEFSQEYQQLLSDKAYKEQEQLLYAMKKHGIPIRTILEDKGNLASGEFDYYTDQIFATDTGQYCTIQQCGFLNTRFDVTNSSNAVNLLQKLNGRTGIILSNDVLYYANQKNQSITAIDLSTITEQQQNILRELFSKDYEKSVFSVEQEILDLVSRISKQAIADQLVFIQARFKNHQRLGEDRLAAVQATNLGAETLNLVDSNKKPLVFEGGDIRQMPGRKLFFIGQGHRTQAQASQAIAEQTGYIVIPIHLQQEQFYHVDCCFLPLPNDAALIYEGEYLVNDIGNTLTDEHGWPQIIKGTETMSDIDRLMIRTIYSSDKLVLISKAEALAFATNAALLQSATDKRFKLFINGNRSEYIENEEQAIIEHTISLTEEHVQQVIQVTGGTMDIVEVPYKTMHGSGGSVRCTVQEVACTTAAIKLYKNKPYYFSETSDKLEMHCLGSRSGMFAQRKKVVEVEETPTLSTQCYVK